MAVCVERAVCANAQTRAALCRFCWLRCLFALIIAALWSNGTAQWADASCAALSFAACKWSPAQARSDCAASSANFIVRSFVGGPAADDVAHHCERVCALLRGEVFGMEKPARWQPKCRVVLHETRSSYLRAVERGGSQTIGSSAISLSGGRVTQRRVDLLAENPEQGLAALPHELVHVLFADAFPTTAPPKWTEEGLALLTDPADKRARHARDLETTLGAGTTLPLRQFLADAEYLSASRRAAFYAQSLSLVDFLTGLASPKEFVRFVKLSTDLGQDRALAVVYDINSRELESRWRRQITGRQLAFVNSR